MRRTMSDHENGSSKTSLNHKLARVVGRNNKTVRPTKKYCSLINDFVRYSRRLSVTTRPAATLDDNVDDVIDERLRFQFILFEFQMHLMQTHTINHGIWLNGERFQFGFLYSLPPLHSVDHWQKWSLCYKMYKQNSSEVLFQSRTRLSIANK